MQFADFLQTHLSRNAVCLLEYETGITAHLDAYIQQCWGKGRVLVVADAYYREFVERQFLPQLQSHGIETVYCLCLPAPGVTYHTQIDEALGDGALAHLTGIIALGGPEIFDAVRDHAAIFDLPCCALFNTFAPQNAFDPCGEKHPCADALFFDLDAIESALHGDLREAIQALEVDVYAQRADIAVQQALSKHVDPAFIQAIDESLPPRIHSHGKPSEDELAQLCEAYTWRAVAYRLGNHVDSLKTVLEYAKAGNDFPQFSAASHAKIMALLMEAALELESLEISPEDCADHQIPKDILTRTLQQILLADGIPFDWMKRAELAYEDRNSLRLELHALVLNWDDFCNHLRPIADLMHAIGAQSEDDPTLKNLWIHAARFAPQSSFLKLFQTLNLVESSLYL